MRQSPDVFFYPPPNESGTGGYGVALDAWLFGPPAVCPRSVSGADLGNPSADFFYIAYTHPLEGFDVPFGGL